MDATLGSHARVARAARRDGGGARPARAQGLRRFAIVAGNDAGGGDTKSLLYASADARKVHEILTRLGGVRTEDATLLIGASASQTAERGRRGRDAGRRGGPARRAHGALLLLLGTRQGRRAAPGRDARSRSTRIKARIASSPVDVRIAILDSCSSGAFTRTKGARKAPAFEIQSESPRDAKGLVILTSSTSDEDSQESDAIGGSYFSHHLASGLLGGADRSGDGRVTLFEAYAYAYDRTVADTAESAAGAQHPTFSYDLAGNGDLVLTDVAVRHEGVYLPREAPERGLFPRGRQGLRRRRRSARPTASTAASRWRPAATASSAGCRIGCASARSTCRAASWSRWRRRGCATRRSPTIRSRARAAST